MDALSRARSLGLLALIAASVVTAEVLFTRVLSVSTWYGLAFVVLSLAMLGLTRGSLVAAEASKKGEALGPWIASQMVSMAAGLVIATAVVTCIPVTFARNLASFASMLIVATAVATPLVAGGAIVARLMAEAPVPVPSLYAVDLVAAAVGALAPLALLGPLSGPGALMTIAGVVALAAFVTTTEKPVRARAAGLVALCASVTLVTETTSAGLLMRYPKGSPRSDAEVTSFEAWNALSHVRLGPFAPIPQSWMWSPSPVTPPGVVTVATAQIDGEAATPVYDYRYPAQLNVLRFDATTSAHVLRPGGTACVIGVGGGRDLISALVYGHSRVLGVEINPSMVAMLRAVSERSPTLRNERVLVRVGDGRAIYAGSNVHCEVLQASLVDTWAATSAGAFAHTESTLYTREAWRVFLNKVAPAGVVTFSRWYDPQKVSETARLVSLAVASLIDRGVTRPRDHIALVASGNVATVLVSPAPFTPTDLAALHDLERRLQFVLLVVPDRPALAPMLDRILDTRDIERLGDAGREAGLDTSAPTDERPFFFQLLAPRMWLHPLRTLALVRGGPGVLEGNVMAMFEVLVTFLAVAVLGAWLLGPTLWRAARERSPLLPGVRAGVYFGALGAGFMAAEIALVQRMHVVLGHPTYALIIVLAGLLVATGAGSALSPRVLRTRRAVALWAGVAALVLAILPYAVIRPLARATIDSGFGVRAAWAGGCAALVGVVLGMLFPSGIRYVERERGAPVALALNGATSVLGSVAAITVSVWAGIPATFVVAAAIYLVAALAGPHGWRESTSGGDASV